MVKPKSKLQVGSMYRCSSAPSPLFVFESRDAAHKCSFDFADSLAEAGVILAAFSEIFDTGVWLVPGDTPFLVLAVEDMCAQILIGEQAGWVHTFWMHQKPKGLISLQSSEAP